MSGYAGDTLASALIANGVKLVGRSFKYHRPRGILTAGSEEPNALVELRSGARREPNTRATTTELYDGLIAASQNRWPSLGFDVLSVNQLASPIFVAGFYYKTFMWPAKLWEKLYEPLIRRAAGLGRAAAASRSRPLRKSLGALRRAGRRRRPDRPGRSACGGPRRRARHPLRGGFCARRPPAVGRRHDRRHAGGRLGRASASPNSSAMPDVRIMTRTTVTGVYDHGTHAALERVNDHVPVPPEHQPRQRLWRIVAKRTVVAAGALERPVVFGGNDVPGVMLASAVRTYINRYAAAPARRLALFTNNDDGWKTVDAALAAGLTVAGVVDARAEVSAERRALAAKHGFAVLNGVVDAVDGGKAGIRKIEVALAGGARATLEADGLAVSGGWNPSVGLTSQHRGRPKWRDDIAAFVPDGAPAGMVAAGAANGAFSLAIAFAKATRRAPRRRPISASARAQATRRPRTTMPPTR